MIHVVVFQKILHVCVIKFFSHIGLQIFRISSVVLNYLRDRCSHLIFTLNFQRYGLCVYSTHIDNDKNVMIIFVESCIRAHLDISLPQISINYDTSAWKIFSHRSVQFFHQLPLFEAFLLRYVMIIAIMCKILQITYLQYCLRKLSSAFRCQLKWTVYPVSIYNKASFMKFLDNRQYFVIGHCDARSKQSETIH